MKLTLILFFCSLLAVSPHWELDFTKAKAIAAAEHKYILLNFSGSDWCGPCNRMHKELFESSDFAAYAEKSLVLLNADFPRMKKNQLPKTQQQQNDQLADKYNAAGSFPFTVLLTADGKVLKAWDGMPKETVADFIMEIKQAANVSQ